MTTPLLVVQHEDACPPAWFGDWLDAAGVELCVVRAHRGDPVPVDVDGCGGLLVLGGEMGANDDADVPWLAGTKALIATTVRADRPFLGICLGHQLAAVALGGEVARNPNGHAGGLTPIALTDAGREDRLLAAFDGARAVQWNHDITTRLPDGAVSLATAPDGTVQAARFGERAWGVQFHPEASAAVLRGWTRDPSSTGPSDDVVAAVEAVEAAEDELQRTWEPLARRFTELLAP